MSDQQQEERDSTRMQIEEAPRTQPRGNLSQFLERPSNIPPTILRIKNQIPPHTATRVMKGEIHNVLTVMRADPRYVSPMRFEEELVEQDEHPLLAKFRDLHATLCAWESSPQDRLPDALVYLPPFCEAIQGRDISASITGAALSALHKFLLYGFLTPGGAPNSRKGMTMMSTALLKCTFEESHAASGGPAKFFESTGGNFLLENINSSRGAGTRRAVADGTRAPQLQQQVGTTRDGTNIARTVVGTMLLHDDEQVVLKLLELSALVVRCSLHPTQPLISTDLIVGLLDTCLHVSHRAKRASPLLKSAAADALGQIVLQIFSTLTAPDRSSAIAKTNTSDTADTEDSREEAINPLLECRREILLKLTHLLNPLQNSDATCATSLTLVNIAFETLREEFTPREIAILQNDFCKYLLQWSTTHDLMLLNLTLRVIFNLFQSMRNHLKVPLEVFLTSVHLRILDPASSATSEEREVALESLLEFCQEVALMQDIYLNYDCDISCTNLYEMICTTLAKVVIGKAASDQTLSQRQTTTMPSMAASTGGTLPTTAESASAASASLSTINSDHSTSGPPPSRLAAMAGASFRGAPSVRHLMAGAAKQQGGGDDNSTAISDLSSHGGGLGGSSGHHATPVKEALSQQHQQRQTQVPLNILNKLALDGILAILDSIFRRCQSHLRYEDMMNNADGGSIDGNTDAESLANGTDATGEIGNLRWQMAPAEISEEVLQKRKIKKHILSLIASAFNEGPFEDTWIKIAKEHEILPTVSQTDDKVVHSLGVAADDVAGLLYSTHGMDKANIGEYISKGPKEKYPFHAEVLKQFVGRFDFTELTFAGAIRKFLSKFRLPGEAQCIDRLMEAFSKELYQQQEGRQQRMSLDNGDDGNDNDEEGSNDEKKRKAAQFVFKNSDAVFVLSFSTIMLNTDLHNPSMKRNRRMTVQQFIKNNRGINDGDDIPEEFLKDLYEEIKTKEIKVQAEVGEFFSTTKDMMNVSASNNSQSVHDAFRASWDSVLSSRARKVTTAFFTPPYAARQSIERAGIHDKEMFVTIANCGAVQSLAAVFSRSYDDDLVIKALRGLKQMAKMCEFFETDDTLDEILAVLMRLGRDYIKGCTALEYSGYENGAPVLPNGRMPMAMFGDDTDESHIIDTESPIPKGVLCTPKGIDPLHASFAVHVLKENHVIPDALGDDDDDDEHDEGSEDEDTFGGDDEVDYTGSAAHRGLLALDCALVMLRTHAPRVRDAWPLFIDCICALRDARGLPTGLSDLDDFADSNGNVLPLSNYAQMSQKRLDDHYRSILGKDEAQKKKSWLRSLWGQKKTPKKDSTGGSMIVDESERSNTSVTSQSAHGFVSPSMKEELSAFSTRLLDVSENCDVEKIVIQMGSSTVSAADIPAATTNGEEISSEDQQRQDEQQFCAIKALLSAVDGFPYEDNPVMEQKAIFSLELAARALLTNREKAPELFNLFLLKFETILSKVDDNKIPAPFMVERVVVTILRCSIHLYDLSEVATLALVVSSYFSFLTSICGTNLTTFYPLSPHISFAPICELLCIS